ncbi:conserved hypothetical protein [Sulfolobus islandicus Y.G.57.14]|jgi:hypothetical protein|uniref:KEOPS complex Pcc1-like subunit n=10 Tax=Saccharolobus islandicus TaxID=43080 RepID=M9UEV3_SACIS|nr:KEOPS complex subunit Pcc1 [Sulfolobus islandicus]ACP35940.1 conserved hypothetical protein [Sulfolobus islandicus L.S.2.15]ACP38550.1 conserved hypothetical protein [Sulfolobus islandicus M.14.25]ACP46178.1 conserved hypothetical protein [Sulfolobus islandicus Y.G.57.14]ACP48110.1 conserved hypothetical protein [Sulfolobus islandicus Y.N.15.51]ACP55794.1 conserved hypothetical protein [Sulfolobus islandicus M.16.27]
MIELRILSEHEDAELIIRSLNVDNVNLPEGMSIQTKVEGKELEIVIKMRITKPNDLMTVRNTADEILAHIKALQSSFDAIS